MYVTDQDAYIAEAGVGFGGVRILKTACQSLADMPLPDQLRNILPMRSSPPPTAKPVRPSQAPGKRATKHPSTPHGTGDSPVLKLITLIKQKIQELPPIVEGGVSDSHVFYCAFPTATKGSRKLSLDAVISENPRAAFLNNPTLVADWIDVEVDKKNLLIIGASKKPIVEQTLQALSSVHCRPIRTEPGPWAALRAAWSLLPPRIKDGLEIRILLGPRETLVAMSSMRSPLAWQSLPTDQEAFREKLASTISGLIAHAQWRLRLSQVKQIVVQGQSVSEELAAHLSAHTKLPTTRHEGPPYDGHLVAFGLALGALNPDAMGINLSRAVQKPAPLFVLLPRLDVVIACLIISVILLTTTSRAGSLERQLKRLRRENNQAMWARRKPVEDLEKMNDKLLTAATPLSEYVLDRLSLAPFLATLPELLPPNVKLEQLHVEDGIWTRNTKDKELGERFLQIRFSVPLQADGNVPKEIDGTVNVIRQAPLFATHFPRVQLAEISWKKDRGADRAIATVTCAPKEPKMSAWERMREEEELRRVEREQAKITAP